MAAVSFGLGPKPGSGLKLVPLSLVPALPPSRRLAFWLVGHTLAISANPITWPDWLWHLPRPRRLPSLHGGLTLLAATRHLCCHRFKPLRFVNIWR